MKHKTMEEFEKSIDTDVYLPVMKALLKKYGNFEMSQDLYNYIIENLACICEAIERENPGIKK